MVCLLERIPVAETHPLKPQEPCAERKHSSGQVDTVYKGRVDNIPGDTSTNTQVDLAPIFRQLVKPVDYSLYLEAEYNSIWDTNNVNNIIRKFTLVTSDNNENKFDLLWNYKYEYNLENENNYFWNYAVGVQDYLYEGQ